MALEFKLNPSVGDFYDDSVGTIWRCTSASPVKWVKETGRYLASINKTINANTIVDVFIYDTTKDDDGGAWVDKYYGSLTLSRLMGFVLTSSEFVIYDLTDSTVPSIQTFTVNASNPVFATPTSIAAANAKIGIGSGSGFVEMDLIKDEATKFTTGANQKYKSVLGTGGAGWV